MAEWAKEQDFNEILEKSNIIFGGEGNTDYFQLYHPKLYEVRNSATEHLIVREDDGIKGILGVFPAEMDVCGNKLTVDGFGTMGVLKEARGKGYMKDLMNTAVAASKSRAHIAFLGGRRQRYEYFGFTPSGVAASFSFNRDNARHGIEGADLSVYGFSEGKTAEEAAFACKLYNRRPAKVLRTESNFLTMLKTCRSTSIIIRKNGELFGYASVNGEGRSINEIELEDIKELPAVLAAYLANYELRGISVGGVFMFETEKLKMLDSVCENMSLHCCENFMINDYVAVIRAFLMLKASYTKLYDCHTVLEIEGADRIEISICNGNISVNSTDKDADLTMKPLEATRLLFGITSQVGIRNDIPEDFGHNLPLPLFYSRPDFV
ncbi:MAG: GNAT family N-acetyltransferase [Ruminococcaceae bacterium]|nr:GNAT family N-acetyltransferase [Oscillospiraceae bacterium]